MAETKINVHVAQRPGKPFPYSMPMSSPSKFARAIRKACKSGKVFVEEKNVSAARGLDKALREGKSSDFSLSKVELVIPQGMGFKIDWSTKSAGWGQFSFYGSSNVRCDNQGMSRKFLKEVLCKLAEEIPLDDPEPKA